MKYQALGKPGYSTLRNILIQIRLRIKLKKRKRNLPTHKGHAGFLFGFSNQCKFFTNWSHCPFPKSSQCDFTEGLTTVIATSHPTRCDFTLTLRDVTYRHNVTWSGVTAMFVWRHSAVRQSAPSRKTHRNCDWQAIVFQIFASSTLFLQNCNFHELHETAVFCSHRPIYDIWTELSNFYRHIFATASYKVYIIQ